VAMTATDLCPTRTYYAHALVSLDLYNF